MGELDNVNQINAIEQTQNDRSIVDLFNALGEQTDFRSRKEIFNGKDGQNGFLAKYPDLEIKSYSGTAEQNSKIIEFIRNKILNEKYFWDSKTKDLIELARSQREVKLTCSSGRANFMKKLKLTSKSDLVKNKDGKFFLTESVRSLTAKQLAAQFEVERFWLRRPDKGEFILIDRENWSGARRARIYPNDEISFKEPPVHLRSNLAEILKSRDQTAFLGRRVEQGVRWLNPEVRELMLVLSNILSKIPDCRLLVTSTFRPHDLGSLHSDGRAIDVIPASRAELAFANREQLKLTVAFINRVNMIPGINVIYERGNTNPWRGLVAEDNIHRFEQTTGAHIHISFSPDKADGINLSEELKLACAEFKDIQLAQSEKVVSKEEV